MKVLVFLLAIFMSSVATGDEYGVVWFSSPEYCPPCQRLKADMGDSPEFKKFKEDFKVLILNPSDKKVLNSGQTAEQLRKSYKMEKMIPSFAIIRKNSPKRLFERKTTIIYREYGYFSGTLAVLLDKIRVTIAKDRKNRSRIRLFK